MRFWKEHETLRTVLILLFFVAALTMIIGGWKMTGQLAGLGLMMVGTSFLVAALWIYNGPFSDSGRKNRKKQETKK